MNVYRSSTTMQMDANYKAVKQSRCMTRVITAVRSPINKTVSSRCDPKPGSLTGGRDSVLGWSANRKAAAVASMNTTRIRARVSGRNAPLPQRQGVESDEAQEHANSSCLGLYGFAGSYLGSAVCISRLALRASKPNHRRRPQQET